MILYNVLVHVPKHQEDDWKHWMHTQHMPDVMKTGLFSSHSLYKHHPIHDHPPAHTCTYLAQYTTPDITSLHTYLADFAAPLMEAHKQRYKEGFSAERFWLERSTHA